MSASMDNVAITCAAEVFLATALLHREQPDRPDFSISEIVDRVAREGIHGSLRSGINVHASLHCVANRVPNPARHRMLFATGKHTRRLLLPGDEVHPERTGKLYPDAEEIPEKYHPLLGWAKWRYEKSAAMNGKSPSIADRLSSQASDEPPRPAEQWLGTLFELEGLGKQYWKDVDPDEFVRKLREGWE
ncbi:MAG: hypothetical protein ABSF23_13985 [Terracidiphilus sp.]